MNDNVRTIKDFELLWISLDYMSNPHCAIRIIDGGSREVYSDSEMV